MNKQEFLSEQSIAVLRSLVGKTIHTIWSPDLHAAGAHLAAWTLSMLLEKDSFINFSCEWSETPKFLNDSWQITVTTGTDPLNIPKNDSGAYISPCNIHMYSSGPIRKIEIFEYSYKSTHEGIEEAVHYDQALLFHCEARSFCIACMLNGPGIATSMHFSEDASVVQEMIRESTVRFTLQ